MTESPDSNHFVYIVPQLAHSYGVADIDTAAVTVSFGENGALAKESVSLVQAGGVWKIDNVKSLH